MITVLIVDDHNIARVALKNMLANVNDIKVIGEATTGNEGIKLARELKPNIILMDIQMPGISGIEATKKLLKVYPQIKIIALTAHEEDPFPQSFLQLGAAGYLTKNTTHEELITTIQNVWAGHSYVTPAIAQRLALRNSQVSKSPFSYLAKREFEIMMLILKGNEPTEIANKINLSIKTVSTYRMRIFEKLNVKNDIKLIYLALHCGLLDEIHLTK